MSNSGWVIELGSSLVQAPLFATATSGDRGPLIWGRDRNAALHFSRQEDASAFAEAYLVGMPVRYSSKINQTVAA